MRIKTTLFTFGISLWMAALFLSCQKEQSLQAGPNGLSIIAPAPVQGSVSGIVTDENDLPVANAAVVVSGVSYTTDANGFFNTATLTLDKFASTVRVNKPGYFTALRSFFARATRNYVDIKLIPKTLAGSFASANGGSVSLGNGSSVYFTAASVANKATGAAYTGQVKVFAAYIDPTADDIAARVPGSFIGRDSSAQYTLTSYGMMAVELETDGGIPLQLVVGKPAQVKMFIPAAIQGSATANIDTWSLDDKGIWKKEGKATKNGNYYEFSANHFSYWNCDIPNSSIYVTVKLTDQEGVPLTNTHVSIRPNTGYGSEINGYTDSMGMGVAFVPANVPLVLSVKGSSHCNVTVYSQNIGSFVANAALNIKATMPTASAITVRGTAVDCTGDPVQSGTATIYAGQWHVFHAAIRNGSFNKVIYPCNMPSLVEVIPSDSVYQQQGNTTTVTVNNVTANAGSLTACGISTFEFMTCTVDGVTFTISSVDRPDVSGAGIGTPFSPNSSFVQMHDSTGPNRFISAWASGHGVGAFPIERFNNSLYISPNVLHSSTLEYTKFGPVGQFVEGNYYVLFTHHSSGFNVRHVATGKFRLKRKS